MITVNLFRGSELFSTINLNISHIREKDLILERVSLKPDPTKFGYCTEYIQKTKVFNQRGGYTVGSYSLPGANSPHEHNRIVISRCSPKDNYDRHKGIMCCIEKIVEKIWPEESFTLVPIFTANNRLISPNKVINISLQ